jgi:phosphoribosylanthranilate isomerase
VPGAVRVKICGVVRPADARVAEAAGADYVGVVLSPGFGRSVDPRDAPAVVEGIGVERVAVLVDEDAASAARLGEVLGAGVLQLHGEESPGLVTELRERGAWTIWKAVRARGAADVVFAVERYGALVDGILLEGHRDGVVGGGGARLDLDAVAEVRALLPPGMEIVLAGGLAPDSVADAVARFAPDVVDVSSGVERAPREKDPTLVRRFVEEARRQAPPPRAQAGR